MYCYYLVTTAVYLLRLNFILNIQIKNVFLDQSYTKNLDVLSVKILD